MQDTTNAKDIVEAIFEFYSKRGISLSTYIYHLSIYVLYGYHKQYEVEEVANNSFKFLSEDDKLLNDLYIQTVKMHISPDQTANLYNKIKKIPYDAFESIYLEILAKLNKLSSMHSDLKLGEFNTPNEILKLITYFIDKAGCKTVFDPFCGTASIANLLNDEIVFVGQDISLWSTLVARVVLDAAKIKQYTVTCADSVVSWNNNHFDAVIACPPFGIRMSEEQKKELSDEEKSYRTLEEIIFSRAFNKNQANILVTLESPGVTINKGRDKDFRKFLVDNNYLDTIISLPDNLLYVTSLPSILIVCRRNRKPKEPVKFIHAEDYFIGGNRFNRKFDMQRLLKLCESDDSVDMVKVDLESIRNNDYNLYPNLYTNTQIELKRGQQSVPLCELITLFKGSRKINTEITDVITPKALSDNFIEILLNKNKAIKEDTKPSSPINKNKVTDNKKSTFINHYELSNDENLLLATQQLINHNISYGLRTKKSYFACKGPIHVYRINTELVDSEYLVHVLLTNPIIKKGGMALSGYMNLPIIIDVDKQKQKTS